MKSLKIFVIALMVMFTATSCGENSTTNNNDTEEAQKNDSNTISEANTIETTVITETDGVIADHLAFVSTEAEDLFNMIANSRSVWDQEDKPTSGGTLVDLNFDGQPEFIVTYATGEVMVYKFNDCDFTEWFSFLLYGDGVHIFLYTDSVGETGWAVPTFYEFQESDNAHNGYSEYRTSIFYCTGNTVTETIKLRERNYHTVTENGVITTVEYYVDDKILNITEQQFQDYLNVNFDTVEWWTTERTPENALWYYYNQKYTDFIQSIPNETSYPLIPGWPWAAYTIQEHELYSTHGILYPLSLIANAYVSNDDYLMSELR